MFIHAAKQATDPRNGASVVSVFQLAATVSYRAATVTEACSDTRNIATPLFPNQKYIADSDIHRHDEHHATCMIYLSHTINTGFLPREERRREENF
jgi:hypothetical protein